MTVEFGIAMALPKSNNHQTGLYSSDLDLCLQSSSMDAFMSEINTFTGDNTFLMESELTDTGPLSLCTSSCSIGDRYNSYDFSVPSHDLLEVSSLLYLDGDVLCHNSDLVDGTFAQHWGGSLWGSQESDFFKMDDVFQVDKDEVVQGPTLAELNGNESLLDTLDFKIVLPEEDSFFPKDIQKNGLKLTQIPTSGCKASSTVTATKCKDPVLSSSAFPNFCSNAKFSLLSDKNVMNKEIVIKEEPVDSKITLQNLLLQNKPEKDYKLNEVPKIEVDVDRKWEVQSHASEDSQKDETSSLTASSGVFSPKEELDSHDEGFDSNPDDSDQDDSSDDDSILSADEYTEGFPKKDKKDRYFWQYNLQSKGPKKRRSVIPSRRTDPHNLRQPSDPVFHPHLQLKGVRHGGKARRGDGNDLTPNPRKLYQIGLELKKLNKIINDLTPVSEMPFNVRSKSRKEKNKLASRACRLKKKAQHEANKLKLFGLDQEHSKLSFVLSEIKLLVSERCRNDVTVHSDTLTYKLDKLIRNNLGPMIAGHTAEFVNSVLDKVAAGHPTGGVEL